MPDPVTDGPWSVRMLSEPIAPEQWQPTVRVRPRSGRCL